MHVKTNAIENGCPVFCYKDQELQSLSKNKINKIKQTRADTDIRNHP